MGPASYWKLTPAEIRIYAEGLYQQSQDVEEETAYSHGVDGPSYNVESKKRRDEQALQKVSQRVRAQA